MSAKIIPLLALLCFPSLLQGVPLLDFASSTDGFTDTAVAGGAMIHTTTGSGSLRLTNPAAWTWRTSASFNRTDTGKSGEIAAALASAGQAGGYLHFDIILRPSTAATGRTGSFWGVQYLVAINQSPPGGGSGWMQKMAHSLPASAFPPSSETTIPVSMPLAKWSDSAADVRVSPDSSYYQIHFGSNTGGASQVEWHIDNVRVEIPPSNPGTLTLEAEAATLTGVVVANSAPGFNGTGYVNGFDQANDRLVWNFASAGGIHRLLIRYRTPGGPKGFNGTLNQGGFSGTFPANNSFAVYDAGLVELANGPNTLGIGGGWNYYEIDSATLAPEAPLPPPSPGPAIPVDPAATQATRNLLTSIAATYGTKTWSGQHEAEDIPHIVNVSGKKPAILAGDLINYSPTRVEHGGMPQGYSESLIEKSGDGHALSIIWHWNAPSGLLNTAEQPWWRGFYTGATTFDVAAALANPAGADHALLLRDIDAIAVQLRKLDQAGIPVLWRPLHEAEGGWFWWGAEGPAAYKQLWRLLFTRLKDYHGLHNLIWVLTVEDAAWYPGDDVVDVIGVDAYPDDRTDALLTRWQPLRDRFDGVKPVALTEFGGVPDIEKMQRLGVWWAWFCSWQGAQLGPASSPNATVSRIYQSAAVMTLDELPVDDPGDTDSNHDGVTDDEASTLGLPVDFDMEPVIGFFRTHADRFSIGHGEADLEEAREAGQQDILAEPNLRDLFTIAQLKALALDQPFIAKDPASGRFNLSLRLMHSPDLTGWQPVIPTDAEIGPDGKLRLELPAAGNAAFYRILGSAP